MDKSTEEFIQLYLQSLETETGSEDERDFLSSDDEKVEEPKKDVITLNTKKKKRNFLQSSLDNETKHRKLSSDVIGSLIPNQKIGLVDNYDNQIGISQYTENGDLFYTSSLDQFIRFYTSEEVNEAMENKRNAVPFKQIRGNNLGYTVIDMALNKTNEYFFYSSWSKQNKKEAYDIGTLASQICPFSIRLNFSNNQLLAGCSDKHIYIFDLETKKQTKFMAHDSDVNSVCYLNDNVFLSGSDDSSIKVWDQRDEKMVGHFMGHSAGISFIHSKGDQTYFISNSKDQTIKLWDIRNYSTHDIKKPNIQKWDYRYQQIPVISKRKSCCDSSLQTYQGHQVLQTLIRCYFSPDSTDNNYIYSGSQDGCVYVYDLYSGNLISKLKGHSNVVRDCTWSKCGTSIISSSWDRTISHWRYVNKEN